MSKIKSKDTRPETQLRKAIWYRGYRYRKHCKLPGKPDMVFLCKKIVVFIDGCFWHKCPRCYKEPKSNRDYWIPKINKNAKRDTLQNEWYRKQGWIVLRFWEHEVNENFDNCVKKIISYLK